MKKSFVFGDNTLAMAAKIVCTPVDSSEPNPDTIRAIENVVRKYDAIRKASIVDPSVAGTPTSI